MAYIITTEAKNLQPGQTFTFVNRKIKFQFVEDKRTYYVYKNIKTGEELESDYYNDLVETAIMIEYQK